MFASLREFVVALERAGELHRVSAPVSPLLEITEITDRQCEVALSRPSAGTPGGSIPARVRSRRQGAALRERRGLRLPVAHQRVRLVSPHGDGARLRGHGRLRRHRRASGRRSRSRSRRARSASCSPGAREFLPLLRVPPAPCVERPVPGGRQAHRARRGRPDAPAAHQVLAARRRSGRGRLSDDARSRPAPRPAGAATSRFAGMHTIHADDAASRKPASHNIGMYRAAAPRPDAPRDALAHAPRRRGPLAHRGSGAASGCRSRSASAARRCCRTRRPRRCRRASASCSWRGSSTAAASRWCGAKTVPAARAGQQRDRDRGLGRAPSAARSAGTRARASRSARAPSSRDRSATTPASTRCPIATRSSR